MAGVKTAISLDEGLFQQVDEAAKEMNISRSRLFTLAVKDYLKKMENRQLLAELNAVYDSPPHKAEKQIMAAMKEKQMKRIELEPW